MIEGKNIILTGCLSGIGAETLKVFAKNHGNIVACAYEETSEFHAVCQELAEKYKTSITPLYFDMMDEDGIKNAAKAIQKLNIEIHGLVNVAGINRDALFGMVTKKDLLDTFQVNFFSHIIFTQYVSKLMLRKGTKGSIAFISSISALDGNEGQLAYASSKAALLGAMRTMAKELGPAGIRVNAIAPGVIMTPMTEKLPKEILNGKVERMNLKRLGGAEEVANLLLFLMSDMSSHITGQTVRIDGG